MVVRPARFQHGFSTEGLNLCNRTRQRVISGRSSGFHDKERCNPQPPETRPASKSYLLVPIRPWRTCFPSDSNKGWWVPLFSFPIYKGFERLGPRSCCSFHRVVRSNAALAKVGSSATLHGLPCVKPLQRRVLWAFLSKGSQCTRRCRAVRGSGDSRLRIPGASKAPRLQGSKPWRAHFGWGAGSLGDTSALDPLSPTREFSRGP